MRAYGLNISVLLKKCQVHKDFFKFSQDFKIKLNFFKQMRASASNNIVC